MKTLEIVTFKLLPTATKEAFIKSAEKIADWLKMQPGFESRFLSYRESDQSWYGIVFWDNYNNAQAAASKIMSELGSSDWMKMINPSTVNMSHSQVYLGAAV